MLIINAAIFFGSVLLGMNGLLNVVFGLRPVWIHTRFTIWTFFTYMFLHGGLGHLGWNMFALWMFGSELEYSWGTKDFIKYYVICGIGGGFLVWVTSFFGLSDPFALTIGASGAIFGLLVAYGMMWPDRIILIFAILPMKAIHFVILFGALDLFKGVTQVNSGVAYFAHIGGGVIGFLYLKYWWRILVHIESFKKHSGMSDRQRKKRFKVVDGGRGKKKADSEETSHPDIQEEVDRILEKIARLGMESLTDNERKILDRASKRKR
ncbi:rhomboid family intramembrane serine protease [Candidatus Latescibacterota bacterium]